MICRLSPTPLLAFSEALLCVQAASTKPSCRRLLVTIHSSNEIGQAYVSNLPMAASLSSASDPVLSCKLCQVSGLRAFDIAPGIVVAAIIWVPGDGKEGVAAVGQDTG